MELGEKSPWGTSLPDQKNPYYLVERNADGTPACTEDQPYIISQFSMHLRSEAYKKFWTSYPPMSSLPEPEKLPVELRREKIMERRHAKDGFLLYYGFLTTEPQRQACLKALKLDGHGGNSYGVLNGVRREIDKRSQGTLRAFKKLYQATPVPVGDEDLNPAVLALYPNGRIGIGQDGNQYTEEEEAAFIKLLANILRPFTGQTEPMWYWDYVHSPNFANFYNKKAWDVAGVVLEDEDGAA